VTGAARRIGQACAWALAAEGADVVAADLGPSDATLARVRELGRRALDVRFPLRVLLWAPGQPLPSPAPHCFSSFEV
jgi:NAD(P)-dependent dehydrogenase (short-subunit alcohol dehydrogenase family)